jgi:hypothetical protein
MLITHLWILEVSTMKKLIVLAEGLLLLCGSLMSSACFYGPRPDPDYAYGPRYGYVAPPLVAAGDYDDHHVWHDRGWWVSNHRDWVMAHHPGWNHDRDNRG